MDLHLFVAKLSGATSPAKAGQLLQEPAFPQRFPKGLLVATATFAPSGLTTELTIFFIGRPVPARRAPRFCTKSAPFLHEERPVPCDDNALLQPLSTPDSAMEEGRTNLVPRLQQDAYVHDFAAAQPG